MNETKEPKLFEVGHPASDFVLTWWANLKQNKGDRAELRRCKDLLEIQKTSSYQRCYWQLIKHYSQEKQQPSREQMSIIIGMASHIDENDTVKKDDQRKNQETDYFGYQISRGDKPKLSELRFRRLLKIKDRDRLHHFLVQVIRILERKVNILDLLSVAYYWGDNVKANLTYKYYEKANLEK